MEKLRIHPRAVIERLAVIGASLLLPSSIMSVSVSAEGVTAQPVVPAVIPERVRMPTIQETSL